jgi:hypothetical protein
MPTAVSIRSSGRDCALITTPVKLDVVADGNRGNVSTRTRIAAGDDVAIVGFVVTGTAQNNS